MGTLFLIVVIGWALFVGFCVGFSMGAEDARKVIRRFYK